MVKLEIITNTIEVNSAIIRKEILMGINISLNALWQRIKRGIWTGKNISRD
jgi:hypothetical protein